MTREEAIRIIRKMLACTDLSVRANLNADMVDACHLAIQALEQEPRWISVSKRLPESSGNYLITYCYQNEIETQEAVYSEDEVKWFDITDVEITLAVIAWMPLPKPYREVEE